MFRDRFGRFARMGSEPKTGFLAAGQFIPWTAPDLRTIQRFHTLYDGRQDLDASGPVAIRLQSMLHGLLILAVAIVRTSQPPGCGGRRLAHRSAFRCASLRARK